jgi:ABC-type lipoprotein release transport system permease subunit
MEAGPPRSRRRVLGILLAAVVLVAVVGIAYSLLRGGGAQD